MEPVVGWLALVLAVGSWVCSFVLFFWERHARRQESRAAEKRARWDGRLEPVWRYAQALREFADTALTRTAAWEARLDDWDIEDSGETLREELSRRWSEVQDLKPRPSPWYLVPDHVARNCLLMLEGHAGECERRCRLSLEGGDPVVFQADRLRGMLQSSADDAETAMQCFFESLT